MAVTSESHSSSSKVKLRISFGGQGGGPLQSPSKQKPAVVRDDLRNGGILIATRLLSSQANVVEDVFGGTRENIEGRERCWSKSWRKRRFQAALVVSDGFYSAVVLVTPLIVGQSRGTSSMLIDTVFSCKNNASATLEWLHTFCQPDGNRSPSGMEHQEPSSDTGDFRGGESTV